MVAFVRRSRSTLRFISGLVALSAAGAVAAFAADAGACSGIAVADDFSVVAEVPENGQLLGTYSCRIGTSCSFPRTLQVLDSSGQPVSGELTVSESSAQTSAVYTFRPTQPWVLGETYSVTDLATAPLAPSASTFTVVSAVTSDAGRISATPELGETRTPLEEVCCVTGEPGSCVGVECVALEHQLGLGVGMQVALPADQMGQWLSRLHAANLGEEDTRSAVAEAVSPWGFPDLRITEPRSLYCVQVELMSLIDGTTILREPQCVAPDTIPDFGRQSVARSVLAQGLTQCDSVPAGFEEPWCEGLTARCESGGPERICSRRDEQCGDLSSSQEADARVVPPGSPALAGGCSLVRGARSSHIADWGLVSLAAALLGRGRRRSRRTTPHHRPA